MEPYISVQIGTDRFRSVRIDIDQFRYRSKYIVRHWLPAPLSTRPVRCRSLPVSRPAGRALRPDHQPVLRRRTAAGRRAATLLRHQGVLPGDAQVLQGASLPPRRQRALLLKAYDPGTTQGSSRPPRRHRALPLTAYDPGTRCKTRVVRLDGTVYCL